MNDAVAMHADLFDPTETRLVITGVAGAGKSTLAVALAAQYADLENGDPPVVVDFDLLAVALGSPDSHDHPLHHRLVTRAAWRAIVRTPLPLTTPIIIIHAHPTPGGLARYLATGYRIIDLPARRP